MAKDAIINVRIEKETKKAAEELYSRFGLSVSDAINVFLSVSLINGGFPFPVTLRGNIPNEKTLAAMKEADEITRGQKSAQSQRVEDFFKTMDK